MQHSPVNPIWRVRGESKTTNGFLPLVSSSSDCVGMDSRSRERNSACVVSVCCSLGEVVFISIFATSLLSSINSLFSVSASFKDWSADSIMSSAPSSFVVLFGTSVCWIFSISASICFLMFSCFVVVKDSLSSWMFWLSCSHFSWASFWNNYHEKSSMKWRKLTTAVSWLKVPGGSRVVPGYCKLRVTFQPCNLLAKYLVSFHKHIRFVKSANCFLESVCLFSCNSLNLSQTTSPSILEKQAKKQHQAQRSSLQRYECSTGWSLDHLNVSLLNSWCQGVFISFTQIWRNTLLY